MNSPPNWEELLDVDDSDLRLSATTQNIFSSGFSKFEDCEEVSVSIIRGPAGLVQTDNIPEGVSGEVMTQEYIRKVVADGIMTQEYIWKVVDRI